MSKGKSIVAALLFCLAGSAMAHPADEAIKSTAEKVMAEVKRAKSGGAEQKEKAFGFAREQAQGVFDYQAMVRLAVGKHWRKASPEQKEALSEGFEGMLSRMYAGSLFALADSKLSFAPARVNGDDAMVRSDLAQPGAPAVRIDYAMRKKPEGWRVFDVSIDGVSLVASQRNSFSELIRREGVDGLIRALDERSKGPERKASEAAAAKKGS